MTMFTIDIDPKTLEDVQHKVDHMLQSIDHLKRVDLGAELSEWQTEDLHRNKPFTMRYRRAGRAVTVIRPHSLFEVKRSAAYQRKAGRRLIRLAKRPSRKAAAAFRAFQARISARAILRQEMLERLVERLGEMVAEKIKW
jgi:hypothetical protein